MTSVLVWLLVLSSPGYSGQTAQVQSHYFVNASDCEQVGKSAIRVAKRVEYQCVQAFVFAEAHPKAALPQVKGNK